MPRKKHKYRAEKVRADGYVFDSKAEHKRYCELVLLGQAGEIKELTVHPVYPCEINGKHVCKVELDFRYTEVKTGQVVVEDVKGMDTSESRLKRRLVNAVHDVDVVLIKYKRGR